MSDKEIKATIANTFLEVADALEAGQYNKKPVIDFASEGSEHGQDSIEEAIKVAEMKGLKAILIGGEDLHKKTKKMLDSGEIDSAVTMHYPFPIGTPTVGKVIIPGKGGLIHITTTTGTSNTDRISGMVESIIYEIIAAKVNGVEGLTVGVANINDVRQTEKVLLKLAENGYDISSAESVRADGGIVMRRNDLLGRTPNIMVIGSLTSNLMMKVFSSYTTGDNYESLGFGYSPDVDEGYDRLIMIVSRASGAPAIARAMEFITNLIRHGWKKAADKEFEKVNKARLRDIISELKFAGRKDIGATPEEVRIPPREIVTSQIPGIEVVDLEGAAKALWKAGIYTKNGMGCTGLVALASDTNKDKAREISKAAGYVN